jgi:hypothetical protein
MDSGIFGLMDGQGMSPGFIQPSKNPFIQQSGLKDARAPTQPLLSRALRVGKPAAARAVFWAAPYKPAARVDTRPVSRRKKSNECHKNNRRHGVVWDLGALKSPC